MSDSPTKIKFPELVFGFVAPIGADLVPAVNAFRAYFEERQYQVVEIKVTGLFQLLEKYVAPDVPLVHKAPLKERYKSYIAYGNQLRAKFGDAILATTAIRRIMTKRLRVPRSDDEKFSKTVYLL